MISAYVVLLFCTAILRSLCCLYAFYFEVLGSTLILTWIPNSTLKKNPRSIENSPAQTRIARRSPRQEYSRVSLGTGCSTDESAIQSPVTFGGSSFGDAGTYVRRVSDDNDGTPQNNERGILQKPIHIGANVNQIHKQSNVVKNCNVARTEDNSVVLGAVGGRDEADDIPCETSRSSESESPSTEQQLKVLVQRNKVQNSAAQQLREQESRKCSGSSGRSVASVEMDGDNLVVVTEEIDDDTFESPSLAVANEDVESKFGPIEESAAVDANNGHSSDRESSSSDSSSSSDGNRYEKIINCMKSDRIENECCSKPDINRLKESLDLKLKLEKGSDSEKKVSDHNFNLSVNSRNRSSSSSATSGPDSEPSSPVTPEGGHASPSAESNASSASLAGNQAGSRDFAIHNLSFPDETLTISSTPSPGRSSPNNIIDQVCGVFSVDLGKS